MRFGEFYLQNMKSRCDASIVYTEIILCHSKPNIQEEPVRVGTSFDAFWLQFPPKYLFNLFL